MPKPRRFFSDTDFGQMHLRMSRPKIETQTPLICLHMSPQSGGAYVNFMTRASSDRIVIAPDYHGFGESDRPPETPYVTIQDYARTVWQALEHLELDNVDLLGHHTGSKVAAEMAVQHPTRVRKIVMISASIMDIEKFKSLKKTMKFEPMPLDREGRRLTLVWNDFRKFFHASTPLDLLFKYVLDAFRAGDAYQWGNRAAFLYNEDFPKVLSALRHQITVMNPNDDLYQATPSILPLLKNGILIDKPEWTHGLFDTNTQDVVDSIKRVLDGTGKEGALKMSLDPTLAQ